MTETSGAMQVDATLVRQLAELLDQNALTEIEVQDGERRIRVARTASSAAVAPIQTTAPAASVPVSADVPAPPAHVDAVRSPMVGTVFLAAEPGAKPFASIGDTVAAGATLLIIEAMKVMNPITVTRAGKVTQVLVQNGQPVEYDQPLIVIE